MIVQFRKYDVSREYGVISIYDLLEDGQVIGEAWCEPCAYLCGHYTAPELVIWLRGEQIRVPRPEVGDIIASPLVVAEIWQGMLDA